MSVEPGLPSLVWVILTLGDRPDDLRRAVDSLAPQPVVVVANGAGAANVELPGTVHLAENVGIPGGRHAGVRGSAEDVIGFLDDDAVIRGSGTPIAEAFAAEPNLGAVALRLVDEEGATARRHVPRLGGRGAKEAGQVALFLGGASAIRRTAYEEVGGYYLDLFYGHEEVEFCWRLVDAGWTIRYLADVTVFHPRTTIERHASGWELTGRNRVLIARRTLPLPVALVHVLTWLFLGLRRAPAGESRRRYWRGWRAGWRHDVTRKPISWRGVWRLTRLGRPPVV